MSVLTLLRFDLSPEFVRNMVLACCLFCLSLVDLEIFEIPNGCLLIPVIAWFVAIPFTEMSGMDVLYHVASGVGYGVVMLALVLLFDKILGKETMGGGDLKLFVVMGLYLGVAASLFALFFSCILGLIMGAIQKRGKENKGPQIPFGPAIALAFYAMLLYGDGLVNWYMGLL
ncbi:MAG: prepilin peptidase [Ruminococcus sp.]